MTIGTDKDARLRLHRRGLKTSAVMGTDVEPFSSGVDVVEVERRLRRLVPADDALPSEPVDEGLLSSSS